MPKPGEKCEACDAFKRVSPEKGICRANPPQTLVFGMEQVNVPGLRGGARGMRPLTGTTQSEVSNDGWCRQFQLEVVEKAAAPKFDPSKLVPVGQTEPVGD